MTQHPSDMVPYLQQLHFFPTKVDVEHWFWKYSVFCRYTVLRYTMVTACCLVCGYIVMLFGDQWELI